MAPLGSSLHSKLTLISVPRDVQPTQAAATDVGTGFEKLPRELRNAIYKDVYEGAFSRFGNKVEITGSGFVALQSLFRVSRKIRHEVQELLQKPMVRQVAFTATCYNRQEEEEAKRRARSLFHGNVPSTRHVQVFKVNSAGGQRGWYDPGVPLYQIVTWRKDSVGRNL